MGLSPLLRGVLLISTLITVGCAMGRPPGEGSSPYTVGYRERGIASWYGPGFHGRPAASGEVYDMHRYTAAHRTFPFGALLRVHSLVSGREVIVRVNDRGPFVRGRILDVSHAAAEALGMIGAGSHQVELEVIGYAANGTAYWVQVASFGDLDSARAFAAQLRTRYARIRLVPVELMGGHRYRVQVGRFESEGVARRVSADIDEQYEVKSLVVREETADRDSP